MVPGAAMGKQPSVWRIMQCDPAAVRAGATITTGAMVAVACLASDLYAARTHTAPVLAVPWWVPLVVFVACLAAGSRTLVARVRDCRDLFARGVQVTGHITYLGDHVATRQIVAGPDYPKEYDMHSGLWVDFAYEYGGMQCESGHALGRGAHARSLVAGDEVAVILDPQEPTRAVIRDVFVKGK